MRHAEAMNDVSYPERLQDLHHLPPDTLTHDHDVSSRFIWQIREVVNVLLGDNQGFTGTRRPYCGEGYHRAVLIDHARRGGTLDDLAENAGHQVPCLCIAARDND